MWTHRHCNGRPSLREGKDFELNTIVAERQSISRRPKRPIRLVVLLAHRLVDEALLAITGSSTMQPQQYLG
jgi:hypothetical protein